MGTKPDLNSAISAFGLSAKRKLANPSARGEPEDQLRAPFERLLVDLAELVGLPTAAVAAVGESSVRDLKTRPDYAVTVRRALVGFVELKAPGKGADPRKFKDPHDREQWEKLRSLPNLIYSDGNEFTLWRDGELVGPLVQLVGDVIVWRPPAPRTVPAAVVAPPMRPPIGVRSVATVRAATAPAVGCARRWRATVATPCRDTLRRPWRRA